jgi:hypothetical protein
MSGPYPDNGRDAYEDMSEFYRTRHDSGCESELTSHGQTPCRCDERRECSCQLDAHDFNCPIHNDRGPSRRGSNGDE